MFSAISTKAVLERTLNLQTSNSFAKTRARLDAFGIAEKFNQLGLRETSRMIIDLGEPIYL